MVSITRTLSLCCLWFLLWRSIVNFSDETNSVFPPTLVILMSVLVPFDKPNFCAAEWVMSDMVEPLSHKQFNVDFCANWLVSLASIFCRRRSGWLSLADIWVVWKLRCLSTASCNSVWCSPPQLLFLHLKFLGQLSDVCLISRHLIHAWLVLTSSNFSSIDFLSNALHFHTGWLLLV